MKELANSQVKKRKKWKGEVWEFVLLLFPAAAFTFVFNYVPMGGLIVAFKKFNVKDGIFGSPWNGFKNFEFFFKSSDVVRIVRNTLLNNLLLIVVGLIVSIGFAYVCFKLRSKIAVKVYQTTAIVPSFVSWVVVGYLSYALLKPTGGIFNNIIESLGGSPIKWYSRPELWPFILVFAAQWVGLGKGSLFYFASMVGIDSEYFEAAALDGASQWQEFRYVILPCIMPTVIVMQILNLGSIFHSDFGLFYNVTRDSGALYPTTDVIDTYMYRALIEVGDIGMSSAVGFVQSIVGFLTVLTANLIVRKIDPESALF